MTDTWMQKLDEDFKDSPEIKTAMLKSARQSNTKPNIAICVMYRDVMNSFHCLITTDTPDLHVASHGQVFPFYVYSEDAKKK